MKSKKYTYYCMERCNKGWWEEVERYFTRAKAKAAAKSKREFDTVRVVARTVTEEIL